MSVPHLPSHLVYAEILPRTDIDTRRSFGLWRRMPRGEAHRAVEACVLRRLRATLHSPGADLTWARVPIRGTAKALVYRAHGQWRGMDLVTPAGVTQLWHGAA